MIEKRKRPVQINFRVSEEELARIEQQMNAAGMINREAYLRRMALCGYTLRVDIPEIPELISLLRRCSNNINQIAKRLNETGRIYELDIAEIKNNQNQLWDQLDRILKTLTAFS